eukprot:CAMPEP_0201283138 /NCGR_PEP_ID=MMETSP1317-20130820/7730_1 /ASSEMBLY_ACC=CAM_ASM_000770 /TAXON_ID=187299 /ORGANISM="Undescribed Undescribed, Strain Undescribed" /LENGTH=42 /DNA_ID= /DNA_START= /DNA_END= /DNA_ORIENTATION=
MDWKYGPVSLLAWFYGDWPHVYGGCKQQSAPERYYFRLVEVD